MTAPVQASGGAPDASVAGFLIERRQPSRDPAALDALAAMWGAAPGDLHAELAGFPETIEVMAVTEPGAGTALAAAAYVPPAALGGGEKASLARVATAEGTAIDAAVALVAWAEERARRDGTPVLQVVERRCPGLEAVLERRGYLPVDAMIRMRRSRARPIPPLPAGLRESRIDECGLDAWVRARNDSFAGVAFTGPATRAQYEKLLADPAFDASLVRVVLRGDEPLGFLVGVLLADGSGEVETIGVATAAQGAGLGRWVLRRCEELLDERGVREIVLRVAESNRRARALYEREGYAEVSRARAWERGITRDTAR